VVAVRHGILVLHGITMSGPSTLRTLGPLGERLEALGYELIAPNGGHSLRTEEVEALLGWFDRQYRAVGQSVKEAFRPARFWDEGQNYDWFGSSTDATTGKKTYAALEKSLDNVERAVRDRGFEGSHETFVVPELAHDVTRRPEDIERIALHLTGNG
jgi:hypothetical protein